MRGEGGGGRARSSRLLDKGRGAVSKQIFFGPSGLSFGLKERGGGPRGPSPGSATVWGLQDKVE